MRTPKWLNVYQLPSGNWAREVLALGEWVLVGTYSSRRDALAKARGE